MITRRAFNQILPSAALAGSSRCCKATSIPQDRVTFVAYGFPYDWHPVKALGGWPLDHVSVATSTGTQWGCFGRTYIADPRHASIVATGEGDELWAKAIAGPDGSAGVENGVTGLCDQCANRILLPTGIDVRASPGNEIAVLFCGVYGFGQEALIKRIKDAAATVNRSYPGRISDASVTSALARVDGGKTHEWEIVKENNRRVLAPVLGVEYPKLENDLEAIYLSFYYRRVAIFHAYERDHLDKVSLVAKLREAFSSSLDDLRDAMGAQAYAKIAPIPPSAATEYLRVRTESK